MTGQKSSDDPSHSGGVTPTSHTPPIPPKIDPDTDTRPLSGIRETHHNLIYDPATGVSAESVEGTRDPTQGDVARAGDGGRHTESVKPSYSGQGSTDSAWMAAPTGSADEGASGRSEFAGDDRSGAKYSQGAANGDASVNTPTESKSVTQNILDSGKKMASTIGDKVKGLKRSDDSHADLASATDPTSTAPKFDTDVDLSGIREGQHSFDSSTGGSGKGSQNAPAISLVERIREGLGGLKETYDSHTGAAAAAGPASAVEGGSKTDTDLNSSGVCEGHHAPATDSATDGTSSSVFGGQDSSPTGLLARIREGMGERGDHHWKSIIPGQASYEYSPPIASHVGVGGGRARDDTASSSMPAAAYSTTGNAPREEFAGNMAEAGKKFAGADDDFKGDVKIQYPPGAAGSGGEGFEKGMEMGSV
ncbi:hypothetical protein BDK51DRAFT_46812 [Blyttiomyces helicus]|uniref:Uncharacterized protein n=1 Tax=Blyttiomyces helicus TaxID=388810 RepID=A0A4V1ISD5_9FUNG|nr:hypothetical protein BDK51DRAFT_46812 [Blyttiomyces helicus]|eukprot:RKO93177.1 hypothetical protein BDK51DRAFT_46812 [Blyttiomyces helicus]